MNVKKQFKDGLSDSEPRTGAAAGHVLRHGHHHHAVQRHRYGPVRTDHPDLLQRGDFAAAQGHSQQDPHRLLTSWSLPASLPLWICCCRRICPALSESLGHVYSPDRGQLYHSGPCRGLCIQEFRGGLCTGRRVPGPGLHHACWSSCAWCGNSWAAGPLAAAFWASMAQAFGSFPRAVPCSG